MEGAVDRHPSHGCRPAFILVSFALVIAGPTLATRSRSGCTSAPHSSGRGRSSNGPSSSVWTSTAMALIYYFAPDVEQDWVWLTPGSVFATTLWLLMSFGFKYYVGNWGTTPRPTALSAQS